MLPLLTALPPGFDPNRMSFGRTAPRIEVPRNTTPSTAGSGSWGGYRPSLWSRYNHGVASVGDWIADHVENVQTATSVLLFVGYVVGVIVGVVITWKESGPGKALLMGLIVGFVGYFGTGLLILLCDLVINIVMYALRLLLWNGWTLLLAIAAAALLLAHSSGVV